MNRSILQSAKGWIKYACIREEQGTTQLQKEIRPELEALCRDYAVVFEEFKGLLPPRTHDHRIPLIPGFELVNLRHPIGTIGSRKTPLRKW